MSPHRFSRRRLLPMLGALVVAAAVATPSAAIFGSHYEEPYLEAIEAWLENPTAEGAEALVELEASAEGSRLNRLDEAEERMVNDLWRLDPEALLPIAALHRTAYEIHLERESAVGARHSAQRLRDVVNLFARRVGTPEARAAAARQWALLGLSLLARGGHHLSPSLASLSEALDHCRLRRDAPDDLRQTRVRTLHLRAAVLERLDSAPKALDDLDDLLEIAPDHLEAHLRRAVNQMQSGDEDDAEKALRELVTLREPEWIAVVAAQQLARLLVDLERRREAEAVLRSALERFPENARLGTLLAYLERPRWQQASERVAGLLETRADAQQERPRTRYEAPLDDAVALIAGARQDLESRLDLAREALAELEKRRENR